MARKRKNEIRNRKRKPLLNKRPEYTPLAPVTAVKRRYLKRRKLEMLLFLIHYRIPLKKTLGVN